jgi:hypothetical protein
MALGLVSGLFLYGTAKEGNMDMRERVADAKEPAGTDRHLGASLPERIETATFAMG